MFDHTSTDSISVQIIILMSKSPLTSASNLTGFSPRDWVPCFWNKAAQNIYTIKRSWRLNEKTHQTAHLFLIQSHKLSCFPHCCFWSAHYIQTFRFTDTPTNFSYNVELIYITATKENQELFYAIIYSYSIWNGAVKTVFPPHLLSADNGEKKHLHLLRSRIQTK